MHAPDAGRYRLRVDRIGYERPLDRWGRVERDERVRRSGRHQRPFRALPADGLAEHGCVQNTEDDGRTCYAVARPCIAV